ncbi:hypothetical protein Micbo1qcDRAFT_169260, partial [Microdochium bolleyi]
MAVRFRLGSGSTLPRPLQQQLFSHNVKLKVGEALLFAPSAILDKAGGGSGEG